MTLPPALMPALLMTMPPTLNWLNTALAVVAMLMLLPAWVMAMFWPLAKFTPSPALIAVAAPPLLDKFQPCCNWLMLLVCKLIVFACRLNCVA